MDAETNRNVIRRQLEESPYLFSQESCRWMFLVGVLERKSARESPIFIEQQILTVAAK